MKRRDFLGCSLAVPALLSATRSATAGSGTRPAASGAWNALAGRLGGRLKPVDWPLQTCIDAPADKACRAFFDAVSNPYFLGDQPGLTQTFGWAGAWTAKPSAMVVEAESAEDIAAAIDFARTNGIRLVVKGGGHSYKGGSNAANSLLLWTRRMNTIVLHDAFVPEGSSALPVPAVSVGAGAMWGDVYRAVSVEGGRYVQGGGCLTVGVAGLIQSGGFGSFSKRYGLAAASLIEVEAVTADGIIRTVNASNDPELFFALKGGGGGTFAIVTRLTLQTHDLPAAFGAVFLEIKARSASAFRALVHRMIAFYADQLFNPHWGEQMRFRPDGTLSISMVFQDLAEEEAEAIWAPFLDWVRSTPEDYSLAAEPVIIAVPARSFWDAGFLRTLPGVVLADTQEGADQDRIFWAGNREEAGQFIHAYKSSWAVADLDTAEGRGAVADGLIAASRHWSISLHTNKGLAGAPENVREAARGTAMNPAVAGAFALAICGAEGPPAYPGVAGREPDMTRAAYDAGRVAAAMEAFNTHVPSAGSYLAESDYFEENWQAAFWGENHARLTAAKRTYDPDGLFAVHHGIDGT